MPMDALLSAALKVSILPDKDREWIYRHLSKRQVALLKEKTQIISRFKKIKKLSYKDIFEYSRSHVNSKSINGIDTKNINGDTPISVDVFSVLDQYQKKSVTKAFEQLPPVIVASYLSSGDTKWLEMFGSHSVNGNLIDYRELALTQKVPRASAHEIANIVYEKSEQIEQETSL